MPTAGVKNQATTRWFTFGGGALTQSLSDDLNNWLDTLNLFFTYDLSITDDLNSWNDSISQLFTYEFSLSDDLNNWNDLQEFLYTYEFGISDSLNSWNDSLLDFLVANLELTLSDNFTFSDSLNTSLVVWTGGTFFDQPYRFLIGFTFDIGV